MRRQSLDVNARRTRALGIDKIQEEMKMSRNEIAAKVKELV